MELCMSRKQWALIVKKHVPSVCMWRLSMCGSGVGGRRSLTRLIVALQVYSVVRWIQLVMALLRSVSSSLTVLHPPLTGTDGK